MLLKTKLFPKLMSSLNEHIRPDDIRDPVFVQESPCQLRSTGKERKTCLLEINLVVPTTAAVLIHAKYQNNVIPTCPLR